MSDFKATLYIESKRYSDWLEVFGASTIDLRSPFPEQVLLPDERVAYAYKLDLTVLTTEQRARLITKLARNFELSEEEVARNLDKIGCPILAEDLSIAIHNPAKWMMD